MNTNNELFHIKSRLKKIRGINFEQIGYNFRVWRIRPLNMTELINLDKVKLLAKKYGKEVL